MAFLSKTEREFMTKDSRENTDNSNGRTIGPGSYNQNEKDIITKINQHCYNKKQPSFISTEDRAKFSTLSSTIESPGPAAYYPQNIVGNKSPYQNETGYNRFYYRNNQTNNNKLGFLSSQNRLRGYETDVPGPGNYGFTEEEKRIAIIHNKFKDKEYLKIGHVYGYHKPEKKYDIAAVGSYDINMNWNKGFSDWSKSYGTLSKLESKEDENKEEALKKEIELINGKIGDLLEKKADYNKIKGKSNEIYRKIFNQKRNAYLQEQLVKNDLNKIEEERQLKADREKLKLAHIHTPFKDKNINRFFQSFNSTAFRDTNIILNDLKVGPGSYNAKVDLIHSSPKSLNMDKHNTEVKKTFKKHQGINKLLITSGGPINQDVYDTFFKQTSDPNGTGNNDDGLTIGASSFATKASFNKNTNEGKGCFGSSEIRFRYETNKISPGPGQYLNDAHLNTMKITKKKYTRIKPITNHEISNWNSNLIRFRNSLSQNKNDGPAVGEYSYQNGTIKDNVIQKNKYFRSISFGVRDARDYDKPKMYLTSKISPGDYQKSPDLIKKSFNFKNCPFNTTCDRDMGKTLKGVEGRLKMELGPGSYKKDSYFDWHKKSYNIMY